MEGSGRVAVVTGASSGIGEATARALAGAGMQVALLARRTDRIEALAAELNGDGTSVAGWNAGPDAAANPTAAASPDAPLALAVPADVTDRASLDAAAERVAAELGQADVLVNNAGVMKLSEFADDLDEERRQMVEVNLLGAMSATAAFLPQLRERGGDVVNVSSLAGRGSSRTSSVYDATKWGMIGWSEALRKELAPAVRVLLVEPGLVESELASHSSDGRARAAIEAAHEKIGSLAAADVAAVIAFALSLPHSVSLSETVIRPTAQR